MRPFRRSEGLPVSESLQTELEEPFRLALLARDEPHSLFCQAGGHNLRVDIRSETVFIFRIGGFAQGLFRPCGRIHPPPLFLFHIRHNVCLHILRNRRIAYPTISHRYISYDIASYILQYRMFTYITRNYKKKLNPRNKYLTESILKSEVSLYLHCYLHLHPTNL